MLYLIKNFKINKIKFFDLNYPLAWGFRAVIYICGINIDPIIAR